MRLGYRLRWAVPACLVLFSFATTAFADGGDATTYVDLSYWLTLLSRISIPGG